MANFNQIWHKVSLDKMDRGLFIRKMEVCSYKGPRLFQREMMEKIHFKIFSIGPISTTLSKKHPQVKENSNERPISKGK